MFDEIMKLNEEKRQEQAFNPERTPALKSSINENVMLLASASLERMNGSTTNIIHRSGVTGHTETGGIDSGCLPVPLFLFYCDNV